MSNKGSPIDDWVIDIIESTDIDEISDDADIIEAVCQYMQWYCYVEEHMQQFVVLIKKYIEVQKSEAA